MLLRLKKEFMHEDVYDDKKQLLYQIKYKIGFRKYACIYQENQLIAEVKVKPFTKMLPIYEIYKDEKCYIKVTRELYFPKQVYTIEYQASKMICMSPDFNIYDENKIQLGRIYIQSSDDDTRYIQGNDEYELLLLYMSIIIEWGKDN